MGSGSTRSKKAETRRSPTGDFARAASANPAGRAKIGSAVTVATRKHCCIVPRLNAPALRKFFYNGDENGTARYCCFLGEKLPE